MCVNTPIAAQHAHDGDATTSCVEELGNDSDGASLGAVLDFQQQRLVEHLEGHPQGRVCVHQRVGDEFAHDQYNVVSQVRQQVLTEVEADKIARLSTR